jgi:hypothetical protein
MLIRRDPYKCKDFHFVFEVVTSASTKIIIFWERTSSSPAKVHLKITLSKVYIIYSRDISFCFHAVNIRDCLRAFNSDYTPDLQKHSLGNKTELGL